MYLGPVIVNDQDPAPQSKSLIELLRLIIWEGQSFTEEEPGELNLSRLQQSLGTPTVSALPQLMISSLSWRVYLQCTPYL